QDFQAIPHSSVNVAPGLGRAALEEPHHRHRLLRARRERPRGSRAAAQRDEVAALHHSMTSSARASRAVSADFWLATRPAIIFIFLYLGSAVPSAPIQSGSANSWPASASSISANTTPSRSPS